MLKIFHLITIIIIINKFMIMIIAQKPNLDNRRHDVYVAGFFPYGKGVENSDTGRGVMPSVRLALDHVNEHSSILRNYRLHMWWNDTMCNTAVGVKALFDMIHNGPRKLMLFGAACTHVTDPIAKASRHWNLTQLSYADTHPMFTTQNFPNFFRIVPSENAFNPPRLHLLRQFNWTRIGTIYQNEPRYSLAHNGLVAELDTMGYQVVETQSFTNEVNIALTKLKEKDTRIILGNFNEKWARIVFCEAYRTGMYGRKYQWIVVGMYGNDWWLKDETDCNCTIDEMEIALEQTILTDLLPLSTSGEITISGITADEYNSEYNSRRGNEYSRFHGYTYDGIWTMALAIQNVAHRIKYFKRDQTVNDFRYRDAIWGRLFLDALHNTSFEGVTGPVRFYDNERKASILLKQFQDGIEVKVGEYSAATQHLDLTLGAPLKWIGKHPPKDRTLLIIEHTRVNKTVYAILASLAVCGIVMATVCLVFNIRYRNQRYIKMSSPQLNNLIIIGCILTYTSIIFLGLDSGLSSIDAFPYICTARVWTLMAGFTLAFGAMFSKTWRVHSIFTDVTLNKKIIKDYKLFMVVGVLLVIDLGIMITWQFADPFYRETKQMEPYPHPSSEDIIIIPENEYCASEHMTIFVGVIYVYKGILMVFGAFLAWETRHVQIPALNDSRHVGLSVYNVAIMCICGAAVALVLVDHQDALFLIIGVFVMFCTTATLWLVFVPKMLELRRNPSGSIDKRFRPTLRPSSKMRRDSSVSELETKMRDVKALNSKYRKTLLERETELQMLIRRVGGDVKEILDARNDGCSGGAGVAVDGGATNRLSVPLLRKEAPSATETSDITSLCSLSSQDYATLPRQDSDNKSKTSESKDKSDKVDGNCNSVRFDQNDKRKMNETTIDDDDLGSTTNSTVRHRRVSVTRTVTTPKKKIECGTHVVAKSELWDTGNQHRCTKLHQSRTSRMNVVQSVDDVDVDDSTPMHHRSVSERKRQKSPTPLIKKDTICTTSAHTTKLGGYFQSTPNVASTAATVSGGGGGNSIPPIAPSNINCPNKSIYNATSENELLDREILPIFQKLLTERNRSQNNIDFSFGRSCPNISIKCDIVEYL